MSEATEAINYEGEREQARITKNERDEYYNALCRIAELLGQPSLYSWQRVYQNVERLLKSHAEAVALLQEVHDFSHMPIVQFSAKYPNTPATRYELNTRIAAWLESPSPLSDAGGAHLSSD